jgi:hypothetical protein
VFAGGEGGAFEEAWKGQGKLKETTRGQDCFRRFELPKGPGPLVGPDAIDEERFEVKLVAISRRSWHRGVYGKDT